MKSEGILFSLITSLLFLIFEGCDEPVYKIYTGNAPVYMSYSELRSSVAVDNSVMLENPGKVYFTDDYIFIIEELKGIHIYENSNPSEPVKKTFVKIPGVDDVAVSGTRLYANSYTDLVILDIQDVENTVLLGRRESLFAYTLPSVDNNLPRAYFDKTKGIVTGWEVKTIKEKENGYDYFINHIDQETFNRKINPAGASYGKNGDGTGSGGTLPRFVISGKNMLVFGEYYSQVYTITDLLNPYTSGTEFYAYEVRTISVSDDKLLLGSTYASYFADLSLPLSSQLPGYFYMAVCCNPVIVCDTLLFLTSRSGTDCNNDSNILRVVGIGDINNPHILSSYTMSNPLGLAKVGEMLFVCDGTDGLRIYDASDPLTLNENLLKTYPGILAYNALIINDILVLFTNDAIFQYDYSDIQNLTLLSSIITGK
ncbi:MAG: hypothetical protein JXR66_03800 [Bacteroidales bacterium]|nr:hypothetical protein [Bacteroidales bacterium]MBN2632655.1 hypothetical protein [Bacteroidales bacterium]